MSQPEIIRSSSQVMPSMGGGTVARLQSSSLVAKVTKDGDMTAALATREAIRLKGTSTVIRSGFEMAKKDVVPAATDLAIEYPFLADTALAIAEGFVRMVGMSAEEVYLARRRRF